MILSREQTMYILDKGFRIPNYLMKIIKYVVIKVHSVSSPNVCVCVCVCMRVDGGVLCKPGEYSSESC